MSFDIKNRTGLIAADRTIKFVVCKNGVKKFQVVSSEISLKMTTFFGLNQPRDHHGAAMLEGEVYIFGGDTSGNRRSSIEVLDEKKKEWRIFPSYYSSTRYGPTAIGKLYL